MPVHVDDNFFLVAIVGDEAIVVLMLAKLTEPADLYVIIVRSRRMRLRRGSLLRLHRRRDALRVVVASSPSYTFVVTVRSVVSRINFFTSSPMCLRRLPEGPHALRDLSAPTRVATRPEGCCSSGNALPRGCHDDVESAGTRRYEMD